MRDNQDNGRRLRPASYAEKYDISRTTVWRWVKDGKLPAERVDGMVFLPDRLPASEAS
jgi:predicted DNA-binding transcriptional regulator AlpA